MSVNLKQYRNLQKNYRFVDSNTNCYRISNNINSLNGVNSFLLFMLFISTVITLIGYYFVTSSELKLNRLRKETIVLMEENIELENKLDYLSSFYNVDTTMKNKNLLHTAKQVIEVDATNQNQDVKMVPKSSKKTFKWAIGY